MIPLRYITEWRNKVPWQDDAMIEQDLIISRALSEIFNNTQLRNVLAFRGGTALHKLYFNPAGRYSEDIDLVQINPEPIGETFGHIRNVLDPLLGKPQRKLKEGRANLYYRYKQEGYTEINMRLKIEINTREHFSILPCQPVPFVVDSQWYKDAAAINSFHFNELIATKFRALYQRKKGRDLFDIWLATQNPLFDAEEIVNCFHKYMAFDNKKLSRAEYEENICLKLEDPNFINDISPLLRTNSKWNAKSAFTTVYHSLISKLPGSSWASLPKQILGD